MVHGKAGRCTISTVQAGGVANRGWSVLLYYEKSGSAPQDIESRESVQARYRSGLSTLERMEAHRRLVTLLDYLLSRGIPVNEAIDKALGELQADGIIENVERLVPETEPNALFAGRKVLLIAGLVAALALWSEAVLSPLPGAQWLMEPVKAVPTAAVLLVLLLMWAIRSRIAPGSRVSLVRSWLVAGGTSFLGISAIAVASILVGERLGWAPLFPFAIAGLLFMAAAWVQTRRQRVMD